MGGKIHIANLGRRPEEPNSAREIWEHAEAFQLATNVLADHLVETRYQIAFPASMLAAFALELYLKCLLKLETGEVFKVHSFRKLFDALSKESQEFIRLETNRLEAADPESAALRAHLNLDTLGSFDEVLDSSSEAFVEFRYLFEGNDAEGYHLKNFKIAVISRITQLTPEW